MNKAIRCAAVCLLALAAFMPAAPAPLAKREKNTDEHIACILEADPTCDLGSVSDFEIRLVNKTRQALHLVGCLDGSGTHTRYPRCYFEVIGPGGESRVSRDGGCVFKNMLCEKDFVCVAAGGTFDPYMPVGDHRFFGVGLNPFLFDQPGKYRIRFIYSTQSHNFDDWAGVGPGHKPEERARLVSLLRLVPKLTLKSNEVVVEVVRRK